MALVVRFDFDENPLAYMHFEHNNEDGSFDKYWFTDEGEQLPIVKQFLEEQLAADNVYALYWYDGAPRILSRIQRVATKEDLPAINASRDEKIVLTATQQRPLIWFEHHFTVVHTAIEQFLTPIDAPETLDCYTFNDIEYTQFLTSNDIAYTPFQAQLMVDRPQIVEQLFIDEDTLTEMEDALAYKKNIVIEGPPGVGKSFIARKLAYLQMDYIEPEFVETVQFHQSYSYDDFMQGYRPDPNGGFRLQNGRFYQFCKRAQADPTHHYYFIIDEMNRGNVSKIFGELLTLLEADKRGVEFAMPLAYDPTTRFYIPDNVYVIGLMNTADRSLAFVDYALRRRFAFISLQPMFNDKFRQHLLDAEVPVLLVDFMIEKMTTLNAVIAEDPNLGTGFLIGHSYFTQPTGDPVKWYTRVIQFEIAPLLKEYWYDEPMLAETEISKLMYEVSHDSD